MHFIYFNFFFILHWQWILIDVGGGGATIRIFFCPPPFQPSQCWEHIVGVMLLCSMLEINDVVLYCIVLYCSNTSLNMWDRNAIFHTFLSIDANVWIILGKWKKLREGKYICACSAKCTLNILKRICMCRIRENSIFSYYNIITYEHVVSAFHTRGRQNGFSINWCLTFHLLSRIPTACNHLPHPNNFSLGFNRLPFPANWMSNTFKC